MLFCCNNFVSDIYSIHLFCIVHTFVDYTYKYLYVKFFFFFFTDREGYIFKNYSFFLYNFASTCFLIHLTMYCPILLLLHYVVLFCYITFYYVFLFATLSFISCKFCFLLFLEIMFLGLIVQ